MELRLVLDPEDEKTEGYSTLKALAEEYKMAFELAKEKNAAYGSAWREQGYMGNLARILSKAARLKNMMWRDSASMYADEPPTDTARDLLNLTAFFLINLCNRNKWGRS